MQSLGLCWWITLLNDSRISPTIKDKSGYESELNMSAQNKEGMVACITLGTAGHIDHGKTALIHKLTGINADRLKEEQLRGMTIDLGYAYYVTKEGKTVGVIDVPGHEKFVRNMVTGAASIDIVILAVAADDGVMPQTREHLEIMTVMGIKNGIVALTKIDLVDKEMIELAIEDVKDLARGTFLEGSPILPLSSQTGEGLEEFIIQLEKLIDEAEHQSPSGLFRMPIQRVFTAKGFGTVVTGVPVSGSVKVGETVEVLPQGFKGKVRGLQAFGRSFEEGKAGHRVAANISDINFREISRGCVVTTPGFFEPMRYFEGEFSYFKNIDFSLKNMTEVKVHVGTAETMGTLVLLDKKEIAPGESCYIQVRLESPIVVVPGDPFLIRRHSPALSIGGGRVLRCSKGKVKRFRDYVLEELETRRGKICENWNALAEYEMSVRRDGFFSAKQMAKDIGQPVEAVETYLSSLVSNNEVIDSGRGTYLHQKRYAPLSEEVIDALDELHTRFPLRPYADLNVLRNSINMEQMFMQALLKKMEKDGLIELKGKRVRKAGFRVKLNDDQNRVASRLMITLESAGLSPPTPEDLSKTFSEELGDTDTMLEFLIASGKVIIIGGFAFSTAYIEKLKDAVIQCCEKEGEVKIPLIKQTFSTTRKYMIPLMEYLDESGVTRRDGERRFLADE